MAGRPPKYSDPEELQAKIEEYEAECIEREKPMTFSGLAYALGFMERRSLNDYAKKSGPISTPIKRAMLRIEQDYEEGLREGSCTGNIFALKNRGWSDKTETEHTGEIQVTTKKWGDVMGGEGPETE